eukprot:10738180-Lingulodinium_polyedra.AAC.1
MPKTRRRGLRMRSTCVNGALPRPGPLCRHLRLRPPQAPGYCSSGGRWRSLRPRPGASSPPRG